MSGSRLLAEARSLLQAAHQASEEPTTEQLEVALRRLRQPLRIAVAGRLKAGKSTLVNALIGEKVAATDATECTRIITWYEDGPTYSAYRSRGNGADRTVRFERDGTATRILLDDEEPFADDEHLHLRMPSPRLRSMTLVDTPGIDTTSEELSRRASAFFATETALSPVDAVVYVVQHTHPEDVAFLEAFHGDLGRGSPMNAIGVLSRADEVGGGNLDALDVAAVVADRRGRDQVVRRLVQSIVPVAGLLGSGGAALQERDFAALKDLAAWDPAELERALLGVQPYLAAAADSPSVETRRKLVEDLGIFGVRVACDLIGRSVTKSSQQLSDALLEVSGIRSLRRILASRLGARADLLKARSALVAVAEALSDLPEHKANVLSRQLEGVVAGAHELTELTALDEIRQGSGILGEEDTARLERLLGALGDSPGERLGLSEGALSGNLDDAVRSELKYWRRVSELGRVPGTRRLVDVAIRTCEGMLA